MIQYWPNKQSIDLNHSVAKLFAYTSKKLKYNTYNKTNYFFYIDILNYQYKQKLFHIILTELEELILDFIELNIQKKDIEKLSYQILYNLIYKIFNNFLYTIIIKNKYNSFTLENSFFNQKIIREQHLLIKYLLIYLTLGSADIENNIFIFNKFFTPYDHVQILFENFIIQISNCIIHNLLNQFFSFSEAIYFLKKNSICNYSYISIRSVVFLINNLNWQNFINLYIYQPQSIYSSRYQVFLVSSNGITSKYIYACRIKELNNLSKKKNILLFFIEIKDLLIPKIEKFFISITKYILYLLINIFNNIIILSIRIIISYIYK